MPPLDRNTPHSQAALIVGCGYLGQHLAIRLIEQGVTVYGTTRSETRAAGLAKLGVRPLLLSITQPVTFASLKPALDAESLDVYLMVPPGRLDGSPSTRHIVLGGTAHIIKALRQATVRRAVMVSSSAVFGQTDGGRVDADSPPTPNGERAELLLAGEKLWLDAGANFNVLRLAGLYGPGRIIGQRALLEGAPLIGNPQALLNLIHVDDAARLLLAMTATSEASRIELGCDGHPVPRIDYYQHLADQLGVAPPSIIDHQVAAARFGLNADRLARAANKALDNTVTCRRTGWSPAFPDFRAGLDAILNTPSTTTPQSPGHPC